MPGVFLSQITVYPVKSCGGFALQSAALADRGLQYDRRWMVVDDEYHSHVTQREVPRLALVSVEMRQDQFLLSTPQGEILRIPSACEGEGTHVVTIWNDRVHAADGGDEAAAWLSAFIGRRVRLVYMPEASDRLARGKGHAGPVSFADETPLLLISEASLDDLNSRLEEPVPMNRFRPNLVVRGCNAYAEDQWTEIRVGSVTLYPARPCGRCVTTTVDQRTGEKGLEPLKTLATYRQRDGNVIFGQRMIHKGHGTLHTGEEMVVVS